MLSRMPRYRRIVFRTYGIGISTSVSPSATDPSGRTQLQSRSVSAGIMSASRIRFTRVKVPPLALRSTARCPSSKMIDIRMRHHRAAHPTQVAMPRKVRDEKKDRNRAGHYLSRYVLVQLSSLLALVPKTQNLTTVTGPRMASGE